MEWLLISMFRFRSAVCQIDLLRRSATLAEDGIREALHSTPKDLDKTYEQIFEVMANEAPVLTRSVLRWIEFNMHQADYPNGVPLSFMINVLLGPSSSSTLPLAPYKEQEEWLRDMCGCLIHIDPEHESVSFAHHTVREFLRSDRIAIGPSKYFQLDNSSLLHQCVPTLLEKIPNAIQQGKISKSSNWTAYTYWEDSVQFLINSTEDEFFGVAILRQESFRELMFAFLRQERLRNTCIWFQPGLSIRQTTRLDWFYSEQKEQDSDSVLLLRLALIGAYKLADCFLSGKEASSIFRAQICLARYEALPTLPTEPDKMSGTIVDLGLSIVFGEIESSPSSKYKEFFRILGFLYTRGAGFFDPSFALASLSFKAGSWISYYRCSHEGLDSGNCTKNERCLAHILSDQGADPSWADPSWVKSFLEVLQTLAVRGELPGGVSLFGMGGGPRHAMERDLNGISGLKLSFSLERVDSSTERLLLVEYVDN